MTVASGFGWVAILRLGAVQASIGAIVMLATSLLNRLMVVEYGLAAAIPAGLVAWHYTVQLLRPLWGQGSDQGHRRTPWILGGMVLLGLGALGAVNATVLLASVPLVGTLLAVLAFTLIGGGVGAAGTSMLALLASGVAPDRRAAAAATTWIMMVAGIVVSASVAGALLDPYSPARLKQVAGGVVGAALLVTVLAVFRLERQAVLAAPTRPEPVPEFREAVSEIFSDLSARAFTLFIFVSMLAYSMQDLILEPFAGLVFDMTPGESTTLAGMQHVGILIGMVVAGIGGSGFAGRMPGELRNWIATGCLGSAAALAALALGAEAGPGWPLATNVFALGFFNGLFAVASIGAMMGLAGAGRRTREGVRMGVWGAAQAIAFGFGGLLGALGVDLARSTQGHDAAAFQLIFAIEAVLFLVAAGLALRVASRESPPFSGVVST